jgi:hypothetical protein
LTSTAPHIRHRAASKLRPRPPPRLPSPPQVPAPSASSTPVLLRQARRPPMGPLPGGIARKEGAKLGEAALLQLRPGQIASEWRISRRFPRETVSGGRLVQLRLKQLPKLLAKLCQRHPKIGGSRICTYESTIFFTIIPFEQPSSTFLVFNKSCGFCSAVSIRLSYPQCMHAWIPDDPSNLSSELIIMEFRLQLLELTLLIREDTQPTKQLQTMTRVPVCIVLYALKSSAGVKN